VVEKLTREYIKISVIGAVGENIIKRVEMKKHELKQLRFHLMEALVWLKKIEEG